MELLKRLGPATAWTEACARTPFDNLTSAPFDIVHKWAGPFSFNQRVIPAKVVASDALSLVYIPVWKAASTELTQQIHSADPRAIGPHPHVFTTHPVVDQVLKNHTGRLNVVSVARDPITRFVTGVFPHFSLPLCHQKPCQKHMRVIRNAIRRLPFEVYRVSEYEHILPQTTFLRATDADGRRLRPRIYRMESMRVEHKANAKSDHVVQAYVSELGVDDTRTLCRFYVHDFRCLGYELPVACRGTTMHVAPRISTPS